MADSVILLLRVDRGSGQFKIVRHTEAQNTAAEFAPLLIVLVEHHVLAGPDRFSHGEILVNEHDLVVIEGAFRILSRVIRALALPIYSAFGPAGKLAQLCKVERLAVFPF